MGGGPGHAEEFVPLPDAGRRYGLRRRVRLGDVDAGGRLRLDAIARYLQDVAGEDAAEAAVGGTWVVRRTAVRVDRQPRYLEPVEVTTFCSGIGGRWAERRTTIAGDRGHVEAASLWVLVDRATGRPQRVPAAFHAVYGEAAGGRTVSSRLTLPAAPPAAGPIERRPWPLRATDLDVLGHVNNARYWEAVEDELHRRGITGVAGAVVEHRTAIEPHDAVEIVSLATAAGVDLWLVSGRGTHAAVRITIAPR